MGHCTVVTETLRSSDCSVVTETVRTSDCAVVAAAALHLIALKRRWNPA